MPPSYLCFDGAPVATEFIGTSDQQRRPAEHAAFEPHPWNPQISGATYHHGYVRVELTPEAWRSDFRIIDFVDAGREHLGVDGDELAGHAGQARRDPGDRRLTPRHL